MNRWLLDEQLPLLLTCWLEQQRQHAIHANDLSDSDRESDEHIATWARAHHYIMISKDIDFIDLYFRKGVPEKLLFLDVGNITKHQLIHVFELHFDQVREQIQETDWLIMNETEVRSYW